MHTRSKLFAALAAGLMMLGLGSAAHAGRLRVDDTHFKWIDETLNLTSAFGTTTRCPATLLGDYHSTTITKVRGSLVADVSLFQVDDGACVGGRASVLGETSPWHLRYDGFTGRLPSINELRVTITGWALWLRQVVLGAFEVTCLITSTSEEPVIATLSLASGVVTTVSMSGTIDSRDTTGTACDDFGNRLTVSGSGRVTDLAGNPVTTTLI